MIIFKTCWESGCHWQCTVNECTVLILIPPILKNIFRIYVAIKQNKGALGFDREGIINFKELKKKS